MLRFSFVLLILTIYVTDSKHVKENPVRIVKENHITNVTEHSKEHEQQPTKKEHVKEVVKIKPVGHCIDIKTYEQYQEIVRTTKDKLVVLDLGARISDAYQYLTPELEWAARRFADKVLFITVDFNVVPQIYFDVKCPFVPTLIVFRNGHVIDAFVTVSEWEVERRLEKILAEEK